MYFEKGHGFIGAATAPKEVWASAPEGGNFRNGGDTPASNSH
jgi:hypothetical protein